MKLKPDQYLTPGGDHSYDVQTGNIDMVSKMPRTTVTVHAQSHTYYEYVGDEYLEEGETTTKAPVLE